MKITTPDNLRGAVESFWTEQLEKQQGCNNLQNVSLYEVSPNHKQPEGTLNISLQQANWGVQRNAAIKLANIIATCNTRLQYSGQHL